eukprot:UN04275
MNRINISSSYQQLYGYSFFILTCIACVIPWILSTAIFFCEPKYANNKCLGTTSQTKCFIMCLLSMMASIAAVTLGIIMVLDNDCVDGLYEFIINKLATDIKYYPAFSEDDITVSFGATLVFVMINLGITLIFTVYCGNGARHHEALKNNVKNKLFSLQVKLKRKKHRKKSSLSVNSHQKQNNKFRFDQSSAFRNDGIKGPPFKALNALSPCNED